MHLVPCQHSLSAPGGGGGGGILQMRVKIKTPKIPYGYHQNPRKILGSKINPFPPPQNPLLNFLALKFPESKTSLVVFIRRTIRLGYARTTTNFQIVLAKERLAKLCYPKQSWNQKFQTPQNIIFLSSSSLEIWSTP